MVIERRVTALCVVEALNEVEDRVSCFIVIPEACSAEQLALERP
jgi:hypothetical protein